MAATILARIGARLLGQVNKVRGLSNATQAAVVHVREAREVIDGLKILSRVPGQNSATLGRYFSNFQAPYTAGHNGLRDVAAKIIDDYQDFKVIFDEALKIPGISAEARAAIEAERAVFTEAVKVIEARQKVRAAADTTDAIVDALNTGKLSEIPGLVQTTLNDMDEALKAAEQAAVALDRVATVFEREASLAAIRAAAVGGAGVATVLTASEAQATSVPGNDDLAAGTYGQVDLDGIGLGLVAGGIYNYVVERGNEDVKREISQAERAAELNVDAFIGQSRINDEAELAKIASDKLHTGITIPDQPRSVVIPPGVDLKKRVVWKLAEEGQSLPGPQGPLPSIVPKG